MAYVHLKESSMGGGIAKIIGKLQGKISANVIKQAAEVSNNLRTGGCPTSNKLNSLQNTAQGLNNSLSKIDRRLDKFRRVPKKLRPPISALKKIIKVIRSLPIPQSVPPGFGLPLNITTKFSDLLVKIREFVIQVEEIIFSIETALDVPATSLKSTKDILSRTDTAITSCIVSRQLEDEIQNGNIDNNQLSDAGLLDDDGVLIFSTLGPTLIGTSNLTNDGDLVNSKKLCTQEQIDNNDTDNCMIPGTGSGTNGKFRPEDFNTDQAGIDASLAKLNDALKKLQDSNISDNVKNNLSKLLDKIQDLGAGTGSGPQGTGPNVYVAANGISYLLEIQKDPNSPSIAPKRFAVAKTLDEGVAVLKGQPSFSSDTEVLLDEVKFRLDNQLP